MRLGILGGTFDPTHYGHLMAAEAARCLLRLDLVLFTPAAVPPHKSNRDISSVEHRLAMLAMAIEDNPAFRVSRVDVDRPKPQYSIDTVRLLRSEWGTDADNTFFLVGADSLAQLLTWHRPDMLVANCRLAVVPRPEYEPDLSSLEQSLPGLSARTERVEMPPVGISSTDLRRRSRLGLSVRYQTPDCVARYMLDHQLYSQDRESATLEKPFDIHL